MQEIFSEALYSGTMKADSDGARLKKLREAAGLSQRELARQIGDRQSNVQYWEATGKFPRSDLLVPIAKALGVTVEDLLGQPAAKQRPARGRLQQAFEEASNLPRRQRDQIAKVVNALVIQARHEVESAK